MRVLIVTGDTRFGPGHERYELQRSAVEDLQVVYWGRGSLWPKIPTGKFDVVSSQDPFWRGLFAWWVSKRVGAKFNVQVHTDLAGVGAVKHVLSQIVLRHAHSVRVVSEKIKKQVEGVGMRAQVTVLPIYIDVEKFKNIVRTPHEQKTIMWVGRFEREKDPLLALAVFKEVQKSVEARLIMLGKGSLEDTLKKEAQGMPLEFPGWQDPLPYLAEADVVLSTSPYESYGASILEALASGVPVVSLDVGIAREAGAIVTANQMLAQEVIKVLQSGTQGELKIPLFSKEEWATQWQNTLQP